MATAAKQPIISSADDIAGELSIVGMQGPNSSDSVCSGCIRTGRAPFDRIGLEGRRLELEIGGEWWLAEVTSLDGCKERIDAIEVRQTAVPMLVMRITETCKGTAFTLRPGEVSEVIVMCGIGPSGKPSCAERELGRVASGVARSKHSRMEFACDGTLITTEWDGNFGDMLLSHRKDVLRFP